MLTRLLVFALLTLFPTFAVAQAPKEPAKKQKMLVTREQVPGYEPQLVEGFTLIFSKEAMAHKDDKEFQRTPIQVLEQELKTVVASFPPKAVDILRRLPIWVEWNMGLNGEEGRPGRAVAVYYPGDAADAIRHKMHPLMAKTVRILLLKSLTKEHQPEDDSGRCVILHEIAHAVHDQLLGPENEVVLAAYRQALDRKLIDKSMYASRDDHEFFAEMSCAYFDQLDYVPRTRSELLKNDPVTHKLMESVWGKGRLVVPGKAGLSVVNAPPLSELLWGTPIEGPEINATTVQGKPTLILYWNASMPGNLTTLTRVSQFDASLRNYGLMSVAVHLALAKKEDAKNAAKEHNVGMPIASDAWYEESIVAKFKDMPMALVYDHRGRCVFKGSPTDAEMPARMALGAWILSTAELTPSKSLEPIVKDLKSGKSPQLVFAKLSAVAKSKDEEAAAAAKRLLETISAPSQKEFDAAVAEIKAAPVPSFFKLEQLAAAFKDAPLGSQAAAELAKLKTNKLIARELAARPGLAEVKKLEAFLMAQPGSSDLASEEFRAENAAAIRRLENAISKLWQAYPDTRASQQGNRIAAKFTAP